jgi:hypothetical protein
MGAADHLESDIRIMHERFIRAMDGRLPTMPDESKERYFGVLTSLVVKLERDDKPMKDVVQEMMAEAATLILQEMQR